jgi:hypothetical protein
MVPIASDELVPFMTSMIAIDDHQCAALCGGRSLSMLSGLQLLGWFGGVGGQASSFTQTGAANVINVGNTGTSVVSVGAIYL